MIVCVSPHPDDAALSCGGLLAARRARQPRVVTVFAAPAPPYEEMTPYAQELFHSWGSRSDPMAHRRQEDACALEVLGCEGEWWETPDAIYRHPAYDSAARIFGSPAEEPAVEQELQGRLALLSAEVLLFPLAIGHHVDHQLLFRIGWRLAEAGRRVAFYEDLPYASWEGGPTGRLAELPRPLHPQLLEMRPFWPTKVAAISCYASQFDELTREGVSLLEAVERYAASLLPGGTAERLWWPEEGPWI